MKKSLFFLLMLTMATLAQAQTIVFHENFDPPSYADSVTANGAVNNFALNNRLHYTGTQCDSAFVTPNDTAYLTTNSFSTLGYQYVYLSFFHICKIETQDAGEVLVSIDNGITWTKLTGSQHCSDGTDSFVADGNKFSSNTYGPYNWGWAPTQNTLKPDQSWWKHEEFLIGGLAGNQSNVKVRFALRDGNGNGANFNRGWYIDNIRIKDSGLINNNCQAYFTHTYSPGGVTYLYLSDASYNLDSSQINVISSNYTVSFGGSVQSYPYLGYGIPLYGYTGNVAVCHTITTSSALGSCQSSWCDTIFVGNPPPPDTCIAAFTYYQDTGTYVVHFNDQSTSTNGNINSWMWIVTKNATIAFTSNLQHPTFTFQPNELYTVCLHIATDSGCTADLCQNIMLQNTPCQISVGYNINHVSVINGSDGSIDLTVTGGTPPYTYAWNTGATTQDIYNLHSGNYTVAISSAPVCPVYTYSYTILQPFDSNNVIIDTLFAPVLDTCLNFVIDSFYIASIHVVGTTVSVEWVFVGGGAIATLIVDYTFSNVGAQMVFLTINCNGAKDLTTFISYIYISQLYGVNEKTQDPEINLYPNPVSDFLTITFGNLNSNSIGLKIFNTTGQQVYSRSVSGKTKQLGINVSELSSGVYFIKIDAGIGLPMVKKFLK